MGNMGSMGREERVTRHEKKRIKGKQYIGRLHLLYENKSRQTFEHLLPEKKDVLLISLQIQVI